MQILVEYSLKNIRKLNISINGYQIDKNMIGNKGIKLLTKTNMANL